MSLSLIRPIHYTAPSYCGCGPLLPEAALLRAPLERTTSAVLMTTTPSHPLSIPSDWLDRRLGQTACDRIGDSQRQRREGLGLARKELQSGRVDRTLQDRADAHAQVRRTFSALRVMMDLLRRRSERDTQEFPASVLTPPDVRGDSLPAPSASSRLQLSITVPVPAGVLADDSLIEIHSASRRRPIRARILSVSNDDTSSTLEVDVPNDAIPPGTGVAVQTVSRFGMRSHKQAVDRVFEERVDGYWPDLIRVLCSPEKLKASTPATPDFFFCDSHSESHRLNEKQRRAVEGALGSDHAFCIQGPPGTGKTTVICELLQQLLAKGQRVLVVAPTHVAIDEVLRRIGSRHGVRALRLAWDDSKVAEDVRRYMPSQILQPYLDRSAKVDSERHTQWAGRLSSLRDAVQHVESLLTSRNGCTQATSRLSGCVESASAALSELAKEEAPLNTLIHDLETRLTPAEIMVARLSEQVAATESVLATMQQQAPPMLRWIGFLGFGAIGVQARRGSRLKRQLADARKRLASDRERLSTLRSRLGHLRDTSTAAHDAVTAASAALAQEQQRADAAERLCKSHSFLRDRTLDGDDARLALEECRQQIERLETYSRLSRRFDEIVGDAHREKNDPDALRNELIGLTNLFCRKPRTAGPGV
jgi:AAA domain